MIKLNLKIAIRYLFKNKLYSLLNIMGLALGLASFIIISLYVSYESSYDSFEGSDHVYRVYMDYLEGEDFIAGDAQTYNLTGPTLKKEFPEISEQVRLYRLDKVTFKNEDKIIEQPNGALADETYFDIFKYPILKGKASELGNPNTIVLTETLSKKLFGDEKALAKTISVFYYGSEVLLEVVAVMEDIPQNTHFKTNYLISFNTINTWDVIKGHLKPNWNENNFFTYIKLVPTADVSALKNKIIASDFEQNPDERHNIEALSTIHLHSDKPYEAEANGSISRIRFLSAIAIIILILSWLNYVNLSTVKSMERTREIGIRKVAGAQRPQLILQSLIESLLLNAISILLAFLLVLTLLPLFNAFMEKSLTLGLVNNSTFLSFLSIILLGTLASGLYPALVISKFSPIKALKGKLQASAGGVNIRKGLITLQFFATVVLIIGTIVVSKQISFLKEQPLGVNLSQVIALNGEVLENQIDSVTAQKKDILIDELAQLHFVKGVSSASAYPGDGYDNLSSTVGITFPDGTENDSQLFYFYGVLPNYFNVMDIKFLGGSDTYLRKNRGTQNFDIVINETFARKMGFTDMSKVAGEKVKFWDETRTLMGVIKDYNHFGLKNKIEPLVIGVVNSPYNRAHKNILVKLNDNPVSITGITRQLDQLSAIWKGIFPQSTLNYTFLDKKFEAQYREDTMFGAAFHLFTGLAICIAGLGLFGLTSYTILQRKKEIGIRKISGASVMQIISLLNKDFLKLVGIAFILAVPIAWYVMSTWLQEFAYQTKMSWWIFALAGIGAFIIAIVSVSFQAIKAAITNPVNSLRTE